MIEVALSAALFTAVVMTLVGVILVARARLLATGEVAVELNDERTVAAQIGEKLLAALADAGVYLPSACGGKGTCGQCRVAVLEGGGEPLPTERSLITRRELREGTRLACQLTLREPLRVRVPDEILGVRRWTCHVRSSRCVGTLIKELVLELPPGETPELRAGAFVQVTCPPYRMAFRDLAVDPEVRDEWSRLGLWRYEAGTRQPATRAYSMANHPGERGIITLLVRLATPPPGAPAWAPPGIVSSYLFGVKPGDAVEVSGPFGHFFATSGDAEMIFVGGGVGMAPMRAHIFDQLERRKSTRPISFWYGARSRRELFYVDEFERLQAEHANFSWVVALSEPRPEDAWDGEVGFIHEVLSRRYLASHPRPEDCEYYLCGPPMMIKATRALLSRLGVEPESIRFDDFGA